MLIGLMVGIAIAVWHMFAAAVEQSHNNKIIARERALNAAKETQNDNNL